MMKLIDAWCKSEINKGKTVKDTAGNTMKIIDDPKLADSRTAIIKTDKKTFGINVEMIGNGELRTRELLVIPEYKNPDTVPPKPFQVC